MHASAPVCCFPSLENTVLRPAVRMHKIAQQFVLAGCIVRRAACGVIRFDALKVAREGLNLTHTNNLPGKAQPPILLISRTSATRQQTKTTSRSDAGHTST